MSRTCSIEKQRWRARRIRESRCSSSCGLRDLACYAMRVDQDRSSKARTRIVLPDIYRRASRIWAFRFVLLTTDHNCIPVSRNGAVPESAKRVPYGTRSLFAKQVSVIASCFRRPMTCTVVGCRPPSVGGDRGRPYDSPGLLVPFRETDTLDKRPRVLRV